MFPCIDPETGGQSEHWYHQEQVRTTGSRIIIGYRCMMMNMLLAGAQKYEVTGC